MLLAFVLALSSPEPTYTKEQFFRAVHQVESSGATDPPPGDGGKALGPLQIHRAYWEDARMPEGSYEDCKRLQYAKDTAARYFKRYAKDAWKGALTLADCEQLARIHNGGPKGAKKKATEGYWKKVHKELDSAAKRAKITPVARKPARSASDGLHIIL